MTRMASAIVTALLASASLPATVAGQQTSQAILSVTDGASLFKTYCGSCHGKSAKGDGPLAVHLRFQPPDLTLIAKRNKGTFDADKVSRVIDGREPVKGHGGTDMPVWGDAFKDSGEGYSEKAVKGRIE